MAVLDAKLQFLETLWNFVNDLSLHGLTATCRHELHSVGVLPKSPHELVGNLEFTRPKE